MRTMQRRGVGPSPSTDLEVTRQGKHYLTAADPESGGKWRLKGAIYERDFPTPS